MIFVDFIAAIPFTGDHSVPDAFASKTEILRCAGISGIAKGVVFCNVFNAESGTLGTLVRCAWFHPCGCTHDNRPGFLNAQSLRAGQCPIASVSVLVLGAVVCSRAFTNGGSSDTFAVLTSVTGSTRIAINAFLTLVGSLKNTAFGSAGSNVAGSLIQTGINAFSYFAKTATTTCRVGNTTGITVWSKCRAAGDLAFGTQNAGSDLTIGQLETVVLAESPGGFLPNIAVPFHAHRGLTWPRGDLSLAIQMRDAFKRFHLASCE